MPIVLVTTNKYVKDILDLPTPQLQFDRFIWIKKEEWLLIFGTFSLDMKKGLVRAAREFEASTKPPWFETLYPGQEGAYEQTQGRALEFIRMIQERAQQDYKKV